MTRPSEHNNEWVVCTPVHPDLNQAPTGYRLNSRPVATDEAGNLVSPPPTYELLPATPGEHDAETVIESTVISGILEIRNRLTSSNRMLLPTRWETRVRDVSGAPVTLGELSWLVKGDESGSGAAMSMVERQFERYVDIDLSLHHNPTLGGAGHSGHEADPGVEFRSYGCPPLLYSATQTPPQHLSAGLQIDFGGDPDGNDAFSNHGGDDHVHPLLWWNSRFCQRVEMNFGGHAMIHRRTEWFYKPTEWNNLGKSNPLLSYVGMPCFHRGFTWTNGYVVNLSTGVVTEILDFAPPGMSNAVDFFHIWDVSKSRYLKDGAVLAASPVPQGRVAIILYDSVSGMAVAHAGVLSDSNDDANTHTALQNGQPNYVSINVALAAGGTNDLEKNAGTGVGFFSKTTTKRPRGWIGMQTFVITGLFVNMIDAIGDLILSGWLDQPITPPPPEATAGTTFPTPVTP